MLDITIYTCHSGDDDIEKIAYNQLIDMGLFNKQYYIEPDWDEFNKFIELEAMYKHTNQPIKIEHLELAKIKIW